MSENYEEDFQEVCMSCSDPIMPGDMYCWLCDHEEDEYDWDHWDEEEDRNG